MALERLSARLPRSRNMALSGAIAAALLAGSLGAPAAQAATKPPVAKKETPEHALIHWINVKRVAAKVPPLAKSADLTAVAHKHVARMAKARKVFHDPHLTTELHGWLSLGEDVGSAGRLSDLEKAFLHSAAGVDLLKPGFRQVGVGIVVRDGLIYADLILRQPSHH